MASLGVASLPEALAMPISVSSAFFDSEAFKRMVGRDEARDKAVLAALARIDNVVRAVGSLGKAVSALASSR